MMLTRASSTRCVNPSEASYAFCARAHPSLPPVCTANCVCATGLRSDVWEGILWSLTHASGPTPFIPALLADVRRHARRTLRHRDSAGGDQFDMFVVSQHCYSLLCKTLAFRIVSLEVQWLAEKSTDRVPPKALNSFLSTVLTLGTLSSAKLSHPHPRWPCVCVCMSVVVLLAAPGDFMALHDDATHVSTLHQAVREAGEEFVARLALVEPALHENFVRCGVQVSTSVLCGGEKRILRRPWMTSCRATALRLCTTPR